jgi:iron complex outermembrane receptor protein
LNDGIYNQAALGNDFLLDVDLIDRVEVIRGPASSLYGADAFLGIINVQTRRGRDIRGVEVSGDAGTFSSFDGRVTYGDQFANGLEVLASVSKYGGDGPSRLFFPEFDSPETNNGIALNADAERANRFYGNVSYGDVQVTGGFVFRNKTVPTASYETQFNTDGTWTDDDRAFLSAKFDHDFANNVNVMGRFFYDKYSYFGQYLWDASDWAEEGDPLPLFLDNLDYADSETVGSEWQVSKAAGGQHVIAGGEFRNHFRQDQSNGDLYPGPEQFYDEYLDIQSSGNNWAVFIQDELEVNPSVTVTAGVRYDNYSSFGGKASPRVAMVYRPQSSTAVKVMYGEAFRAPSTYELDYHDGGESQKANPNLEPETMRSVEFSVQQGFGESVLARVSVYHQKPENLIGWVLDPVDELNSSGPKTQTPTPC